MEFNKTIHIYGAGGHGSVVFSVLEDSKYEILGFIDNDKSRTEYLNIPIIHPDEFNFEGNIILGIGNNIFRYNIANKYNIANYSTVIHSSAYINKYVKIEHGTVIMQNSTIQINSQLGKHVIVNTGSCIDHDCFIDDFVHISPNATITGGVKIGLGSWIGAGAVVLPGIKIGKWCTIGAGSVVNRDVEDYNVVVGVPAKKINESKHGEY